MNHFFQVEFMPSSTNSTLLVEAGHIYTNEAPSEEHNIGCKIGGLISVFGEAAGFKIMKMLFIDDYNPKFQNKAIVLNENQYKNQLSSLGFNPDKTIYESTLVQDAHSLLDKLLSDMIAVEDGSIVKLNKGKNIQLYDKEKNIISCALLDACLYLKKLDLADCLVTVIGQEYKAQQKATMHILRKTGVNISSILPVYYSADLNQQISIPEPYSPGGLCSEKMYLTCNIVNTLKSLAEISKTILLTTSIIPDDIDVGVMQYVV